MRTPLAGPSPFRSYSLPLLAPPAPFAKNTKQEEVFAQGCWWDRDDIRKEGYCSHTRSLFSLERPPPTTPGTRPLERSPPADQPSLPGRHQVSLCLSSLYRMLALLPHKGPQGHLSCLSDSWHSFFENDDFWELRLYGQDYKWKARGARTFSRLRVLKVQERVYSPDSLRAADGNRIEAES